MERISSMILKDLLPAEKEVAPAPVKAAHDPARADHWSPAILLERARYLRELARHGDGSASEVLKDYPRHNAQLSFRSRDGVVEVHQRFADLFRVLAGKATLITGGTVVGAKMIAPGETRGDSIEGGKRQELRAGDMVHIPAGVPHQMLVSSDDTFTAFVLKIEEAGD